MCSPRCFCIKSEDLEVVKLCIKIKQMQIKFVVVEYILVKVYCIATSSELNLM